MRTFNLMHPGFGLRTLRFPSTSTAFPLNCEPWKLWVEFISSLICNVSTEEREFSIALGREICGLTIRLCTICPDDEEEMNKQKDMHWVSYPHSSCIDPLEQFTLDWYGNKYVSYSRNVRNQNFQYKSLVKFLRLQHIIIASTSLPPSLWRLKQSDIRPEETLGLWNGSTMNAKMSSKQSLMLGFSLHGQIKQTPINHIK